MVVIKERTPLDDLEEMAGLRKFDSGLPVNLWLDDKSTYKKSGHWKRVKVQNDHGNKINSGDMFSITISDDPQIMPPNAVVNIPAKEIEKIKAFIKDNYSLLSELADQEISFAQFIKRMKI